MFYLEKLFSIINFQSNVKKMQNCDASCQWKIPVAGGKFQLPVDKCQLASRGGRGGGCDLFLGNCPYTMVIHVHRTFIYRCFTFTPIMAQDLAQPPQSEKQSAHLFHIARAQQC